MKEMLNENVQNQINRMKQMMSYGSKTESKAYSSVEYERMGGDGKMYAIIREGAKYHIKFSDKKKPLKEDYSYIGGFANHKNNMYESYGNALKHFDMKMSSINEAVGKRGSVDAWNVSGREDLVVEATEKMRKEIARQKEIMSNAAAIFEGKGKIDKSHADMSKNNIRMTKPKTGEATNQGGDFFDEKPEKDMVDMQKDNIKGKQKPVLENVEDEFLDHNPNISLGVGVLGGSGKGGQAADNINGGSLGEDEDFEETEVTEVPEEDGEEIDTKVEDFDMDGEDVDFDMEDDELEEFPEEDEEEFEDDEDEDEISSLRAEIESLRSTIEAMAEKLGVNEFDKDEPLYDDEEDDEEDFEETDVEDDGDGEEIEFESDFEADSDDTEDDEDETVYESRNYRALSNSTVNRLTEKVAKCVRQKIAEMEDIEEDEDLQETELHVFGKHPRFQKEPMTYPTPKMAKKEGQYEEGADEDDTNKPYGKEIGDSTPFGDGEAVKKTVNSIAEAIIRKLRKNL